MVDWATSGKPAPSLDVLILLSHLALVILVLVLDAADVGMRSAPHLTPSIPTPSRGLERNVSRASGRSPTASNGSSAPTNCRTTRAEVEGLLRRLGPAWVELRSILYELDGVLGR